VQLTEHGSKVRDDFMHELTLESQARLDTMLPSKEQAYFREIVIKLLKATETELMATCPANKK
jgi:hypothetical protein